jgi:hypothetical protein
MSSRPANRPKFLERTTMEYHFETESAARSFAAESGGSLYIESLGSYYVTTATHDVIDNNTCVVVARCKTAASARRTCARRNQEYGACRYTYRGIAS